MGNGRLLRIPARAALLAALAALLGACAGGPQPVPVADILLDARFASPPPAAADDDPLAASPDMRRFLREDIARQLREEGRTRGLVNALQRRGQLHLEYDATMTRNAAQAFAARKGNCLALALMTASLARELGLDVTFQLLATEEQWSRVRDIALLSNHVNVTIGLPARDTRPGFDAYHTLVVDFLPPELLFRQRARTLEADDIVAMYWNNRAAELLVQGDLDAAYWSARRAVTTASTSSAPYNTLGLVYLHHGDLDAASRALERALHFDPDNTLALSNLAVVLRRTGKADAAQRIEQRLASLEPYPPYHFFELGRAAYDRADYVQARALFEREVRRAGYSSEFHFWLGLANLRLGNTRAAREEFESAQALSTSPAQHDLYAAKLARLGATASQ